jgi:methanogenic corrinoid protein MtbC1
VDFYGTSMPVADLIGAIRGRKPLFVGLSTALVLHLGRAKQAITAIRASLGDETPPIIVGGNAFRGPGELWRLVGADLYAQSASDAVQAVRHLKQ